MKPVELRDLMDKAAKHPSWKEELRRAAVNALPDLLAEIEHLESFKTAYVEWQKRTEWVQENIDSFPISSLGKHRADLLREEIDRLGRVCDALEAVAIDCCDEVPLKNGELQEKLQKARNTK